MTGVYFGYHNQNLSVKASITIQVPNSGFSLKFGRIGSWENHEVRVEDETNIRRIGPPYGDPFVSVIEFSGYSGYIFDQNTNLIGGYLKDEPFDLEFNAFYRSGHDTRLSYKINDTLIANNLQLEPFSNFYLQPNGIDYYLSPNGESYYEYPSGDAFMDAMIFEDYGDRNNLFLTLKQETGSPTVLAGHTGLYILSSEGFYLAGA
jgi:hypothetical protein